MTYKHLPRTLPAILRAGGLNVSETNGWYGRGRPATTGEFHPGGLLVHHTATPASWPTAQTLALLINGRADLPGPLAHLGLDRDGTVHVIASGRANHAGKAKPSGTMAGGDGNALYIGVECFNDGVDEPWPRAQYEALVKLAAVVCEKLTGNSVQTVRGHKETSTTGKIDPRLDMDKLRADVAAELASLVKKPLPPSAPKPAPKPAPVPTVERTQAMFVATYGASRRRLIIGGKIVGITEDLYDQLVKADVPAVRLSDQDFENLESVLK